ncbi:MAG: PEP-CTERM sorting domain-containing protein [Rhodobacteraceae bacterium]|nr:PEP-CTERM sorting domain-containing protein [Paracoccaceae bacterium]
MFQTFRKFLILLGAGLVCGLALPAAAAPVLIDLTDPQPWSGANGKTSFSTVIGDLTVTLTAHGSGTPKMTFNSASGEASGCASGHNGSPAHDLVCGGDGIGIGDDEITEGGTEQIHVTFSRPIHLVNIELLDLFNNNTEIEKALISLDNGATFSMFLSNDNLGGYYSTQLGGYAVSRIIFKAYNDAVSDYAVARLAIYMNDVPEPGATALFLFGLAGLKVMRRRKDAPGQRPAA